MQLIVISGPSGSGKTKLSIKILKKLKDGIILNTDNYYKTGIISKISSKIISNYFDRKISFNFKLFKGDLDFILKNGFLGYFYKYDFKNKSIAKIYKKTKNIRFVIIEGIFAKEIFKTSLNHNTTLIKLKTRKKTCMKRVIKRDFKERGKTKINARKDFLKAWIIFKKNKKKKKPENYSKKIVITHETNINLLIKNIINKVN